MSTEENGLEKLLASGETETLEFKESFDKETVESAGAFANTRGGTILIGISDINVTTQVVRFTVHGCSPYLHFDLCSSLSNPSG
ncbi:putative DNA binding domain-containing protein [Dehalococcoidia bacterium]|nr:putative DNA binding domain-containing protein [Dehalococcoidia bacterium]MCL0064597.1 putative DNA binding domain-containing protein [Dehalococcoidia bacterium]MCL0069367.1 putative DNA binding domain-containing protein [Dehalococcoidia bacterium]